MLILFLRYRFGDSEAVTYCNPAMRALDTTRYDKRAANDIAIPAPDDHAQHDDNFMPDHTYKRPPTLALQFMLVQSWHGIKKTEILGLP